MAKLDRVHQKIFASTAPASDIGVIGSLHEGNPTEAASVQDIQSLAAFEAGIRSIVIGENSPIIEEDNALYKLITYQLAYLFQHGIAEWTPEVEYQARAIVKHGATLYQMTDINSINQEPGTPGTPWQAFYLAPLLMPDSYLPRRVVGKTKVMDGILIGDAHATLDGQWTDAISVVTDNKFGNMITFRSTGADESATITVAGGNTNTLGVTRVIKIVGSNEYILNEFSMVNQTTNLLIPTMIPSSAMSTSDLVPTGDEEAGMPVTYKLQIRIGGSLNDNPNVWVSNTMMIVSSV